MAPQRSRTGSRGSALVVLTFAASLGIVTLQRLSFVAFWRKQAETSRLAPLGASVGVPRVRSRHVLAARGGADDEDDDEFMFSPAEVDVKTLKVGEELQGVVTKCMKFGAFVDVGADTEGLVPISKLAEGLTDNVEDVVRPGDGVKVWVAEVTGDRLTLSMVRKKARPRGLRGAGAPRADLSLFKDISQTEWLNGTVVSTQSFGAFVAVKPPSGGDGEAQGLVYITQLTDGFVQNVDDVVKIGQEVQVRIVSCDVEAGKLGLSMLTEAGSSANAQRNGAGRGPRNDVSLFKDISESEWLKGTVVSTQQYGAFVAVKPPGSDAEAQGLVHITQFQDGFVNDVNDIVKEGDEVNVRVVGVDLEKGKLSLTMLTESGMAANVARKEGGRKPGGSVAQFEGISDTEWLPGTVKSLQNYGAFVDVKAPAGGDPVQGLVHISEITDGYIEDPAEELEIDQEVEVRVLKVSVEDNKLSLSMKQPA